jgi:RNA polymerase sigma-70 factor (ECF subfamily)
LPARLDEKGDLQTLFDQDRAQWDQRLVEEGQHLLEQAATGSELTEFHVEAAIAWVHTTARCAEETNWKAIVSLYDQLMAIRPSPVVALNRAIAVAQRDGPEEGLAEIQRIADRDRLTSYPFYEAAQGELELRCGHHHSAREHFQTALTLARNPSERRFFEQRVSVCGNGREE